MLGVLATLALARSAPLFVALQDAAGPLAWALPFVLVGVPAVADGRHAAGRCVRALGPGDAVGRPRHRPSLRGQHGRRRLRHARDAVPAGARLRRRAAPASSRAASCLAVAAAALGLDRRACARTARSAPAEARRRTAARRRAARSRSTPSPAASRSATRWSGRRCSCSSSARGRYAFAVMLATYLGGPRARQLPLRAVADRAAQIRGGCSASCIAGAGASALVIGRARSVRGCPTPRSSRACGRCARRDARPSRWRRGSRGGRRRAARADDPSRRARFPAAARLDGGRGARRAGTSAPSLALNTAGGIAGTLLTGFVLVPALGLVRSLGCLAVGGALARRDRAGRAAGRPCGARRGGRRDARCRRRDRAPRRRATRSAALLAERRGGRLVFYEEDTGGTVAVLEQETPAGPSGGSTSRASRTPATRCRRGATCACRRSCRSSSTGASRARRSSSGWAPASRRARSSPYPGARDARRGRAAARPSCARRRSSRATSARRPIRASRSASATAGTSCCAAPSATTSSRSSRRRRRRRAS